MDKMKWCILFFAMGLISCTIDLGSNDDKAEYSDLDKIMDITMVIHVTDADSQPVKGATATINSTDYLPKRFSDGSSVGKKLGLSDLSDSLGYITIRRFEFDPSSHESFALLVANSEQGSFQIVKTSDINLEKDTLQVTLYRLQTLRGKFESSLQGGIVYLYGASYFATRDSLNHYEIKNVAPGEYSYIAEIFDPAYSTWKDTIVAKGSVSIHKYSVNNQCEALECTETQLDVLAK